MCKNYLLVVDDREGVRQLLSEFLTQEGFNVKAASDGQTAIRLAQKEKPILILLDLKMPGLSGTDTLFMLYQLCPRTKIILMSAYPKDKAVTEAIQNGYAHYFVNKPFDLDELRTMLNNLLVMAI